MAVLVDLLKLFDRDFGVDGRRLQLLVAEQLLNLADVSPAFEQVRGARVPEHVTEAGTADASLTDEVGRVG